VNSEAALSNLLTETLNERIEERKVGVRKINRKICSQCGLRKEVEGNFYNNASSKDGYEGVCKECREKNRSLKVLLNFKNHAELLDGVKAWSSMEMRTEADQIIYHLRGFLTKEGFLNGNKSAAKHKTMGKGEVSSMR
jgi:hypothetical protein